MDQQPRWRAFKHGRLSTREECAAMSRAWLAEMDQFIMTRSFEEMRTVSLYTSGFLHRLREKAKRGTR